MLRVSRKLRDLRPPVAWRWPSAKAVALPGELAPQIVKEQRSLVGIEREIQQLALFQWLRPASVFPIWIDGEAWRKIDLPSELKQVVSSRDLDGMSASINVAGDSPLDEELFGVLKDRWVLL